MIVLRPIFFGIVSFSNSFSHILSLLHLFVSVLSFDYVTAIFEGLPTVCSTIVQHMLQLVVAPVFCWKKFGPVHFKSNCKRSTQTLRLHHLEVFFRDKQFLVKLHQSKIVHAPLWNLLSLIEIALAVSLGTTHAQSSSCCLTFSITMLTLFRFMFPLIRKGMLLHLQRNGLASDGFAPNSSHPVRKMLVEKSLEVCS